MHFVKKSFLKKFSATNLLKVQVDLKVHRVRVEGRQALEPKVDFDVGRSIVVKVGMRALVVERLVGLVAHKLRRHRDRQDGRDVRQADDDGGEGEKSRPILGHVVGILGVSVFSFRRFAREYASV